MGTRKNESSRRWFYKFITNVWEARLRLYTAKNAPFLQFVYEVFSIAYKKELLLDDFTNNCPKVENFNFQLWHSPVNLPRKWIPRLCHPFHRISHSHQALSQRQRFPTLYTYLNYVFIEISSTRRRVIWRNSLTSSNSWIAERAGISSSGAFEPRSLPLFLRRIFLSFFLVFFFLGPAGISPRSLLWCVVLVRLRWTWRVKKLFIGTIEILHIPNLSSCGATVDFWTSLNKTSLRRVAQWVVRLNCIRN